VQLEQVSGQLNAPAALFPGKSFIVVIL